MFKLALAKSVGSRLIPFVTCTLAYFVIHPVPSRLAIVVKCLPVICLCGFVLGEIHHLWKRNFSVTPRYHLPILAGLVLSCIGDAFLVYMDHYFVQGLVFFAMAHVMYIYAFGAEPLKLHLLVLCVLLGAPNYVIMYSGFAAHNLTFPGAIYTLLITIMGWRAMSRLQFFENLWTWTKMAAFFGALFFAISDLVLAMNRFYQPIPSSESIVMTTYYTAQLGIALSVVSHGSEKKEK